LTRESGETGNIGKAHPVLVDHEPNAHGTKFTERRDELATRLVGSAPAVPAATRDQSLDDLGVRQPREALLPSHHERLDRSVQGVVCRSGGLFDAVDRSDVWIVTMPHVMALPLFRVDWLNLIAPIASLAAGRSLLSCPADVMTGAFAV
jgi:hypothetical protein